MRKQVVIALPFLSMTAYSVETEFQEVNRLYKYVNKEDRA